MMIMMMMMTTNRADRRRQPSKMIRLLALTNDGVATLVVYD
jgi:hypothetical protein